MSPRDRIGIVFLIICTACGGDGLGVAPCGVGLTTEGGTFTPTTCELQIIVPGQECSDAETCGNDHVLALLDSNPAHVQQVTLFHFEEYASRTFTFDPEQGLREVQGQALDVGAVVRNLLAATVTLEPTGNSTVQAAFDATFANGVHVRGDGTFPVVMEYAP